MQHFGEANYEIDKAIAVHHGTPYIAKNCECWEGYKRVPGTKPCAPGSCEKCDSSSKESATKLSDEANDRLDAFWNQAVEIAKSQNPNIDESLKDEILMGCLGEIGFKALTPEIIANKIIQKSDRMVTASQGDKPSPHAAQAVLAALEAGDEDTAKELLKKTDCPERCETHPEGKCNHQYMSAGRTRVRYLINDSSFDSQKEAGIQDVLQVVPDAIHAIPHVWHEINPAGTGAVGQGIGAIGDAIDSGVGAVKDMFSATNNPQFQLDIADLQNWHNAHPGPEHAAEWQNKIDGFVTYWSSQGVDHPGQYISQ